MKFLFISMEQLIGMNQRIVSNGLIMKQSLLKVDYDHHIHERTIIPLAYDYPVPGYKNNVHI